MSDHSTEATLAGHLDHLTAVTAQEWHDLGLVAPAPAAIDSVREVLPAAATVAGYVRVLPLLDEVGGLKVVAQTEYRGDDLARIEFGNDGGVRIHPRRPGSDPAQHATVDQVRALLSALAS